MTQISRQDTAQIVARYLAVWSEPDPASRHDDIVTLTIQLTTPGGEIPWAARVFLLLDAGDLIKEDYQLTVKPLAGQA